MEYAVRLGVRYDAFEVRRRVFMEEQGYENEFDGIDDDAACLHLTAYADGELAGCARVFPEPLEHAQAPEAPRSPVSPFDEGVTSDAIYLLGRVAVLPEYRGRGIASQLVKASDEAARDAGAKVCKLHAQEYVRDLYAKLGYVQISDVDYEDEGQPHLWMAKRLS